MNPPMDHEEALDRLIAHAVKISHGLDEADVSKLFAKQVKVYERYAGV